jgi:hypothetical protein
MFLGQLKLVGKPEFAYFTGLLLEMMVIGFMASYAAEGQRHAATRGVAGGFFLLHIVGNRKNHGFWQPCCRFSSHTSRFG